MLPKSNLWHLVCILKVKMTGLNWTFRLLIIWNYRDYSTTRTWLLGQHTRMHELFFRVHHEERRYLLFLPFLASPLACLTYLIFFCLVAVSLVFFTKSVLIIFIISCLNNCMLTSLSRSLEISLAPLLISVKWKLTLMLLFLHLTFWTFFEISYWWKELRRSLAFYILEVLLF
jgi:hypothetical protein